MKTPLASVLALLALTLVAQEPFPEAGPHHRTLLSVEPVAWPDGTVTLQTNTLVQLEPGLNRWANGQWVEAREGLEIIGDTVVSRQTAHRVIWAANANTRGAVDIELPDATRLLSHCLGLSYYDAASGQSVLIAELKDSIAEVHPPDLVFYPDAFDDIEADLLYVNRRGRFEQLIVLREPPPDPADYGLDPDTVRLEVISEFLDPPEPRKVARVLREETDPALRRLMAEPDLIDEQLDFGPMFMADGQAFLPAGEPWEVAAAESIPMAKRWQITPEGRTVLFEAVEWASLAPLLAQLPAPANGPRVAVHRPPSATRMLPARRIAGQTASPVRVAAAERRARPGVVLDYTLSSGVTNFIFRSDTTYYVTGAINCGGTNTTFEGGTIIKFALTNSAALDLACTNVTWLASPYRPVILTGCDDGSVGVAVTTNAFTNYYATVALNLKAPLTGVKLSYVRVLRAKTALAFGQGVNHEIKHAQLVGCETGLKVTSSIVRLRNALLSDVSTGFHLTSSIMAAEHLTVNGAAALNNGGTLYLTNSLLVGVGAINGWSGVSNVFLGSASGVFASAAAGSHYLASGSPYRNAGTTAINADLQKDLKTMTTVAPTPLTGPITTATVLGPQAARDSDTPDLGFHYVPLDYYASGLVVSNTTLTLTNGVAVGFSGSAWLWPQAGAAVVSEGLPHRMNHLAPLLHVQEQSSSAYASTAPTVLYLYLPAGTAPTARWWFTSLDNMAGNSVYVDSSTWRLGSLEARHSAFGAGSLWLSGTASNLAVTLVNNLFERHTVFLEDTLNVSACNNLFRLGSGDFWNYASNPWVMRDNVFDENPVTSYGPVSNSHNSYINTTNRLSGGTNDVILSAFSYATGTLGRYYHSSTNLLNAGSRLVADAGLYHFTVLTNQVKDTSTVDVGMHYVATDANGLPLDAGDGDGFADHLEDRNGNGSADAGETDWQTSNSGISGPAGLQVFTPLK